MRLKLRRYPDWRYRYIRDRAGVAVWIGPYGVYLWREYLERSVVMTDER